MNVTASTTSSLYCHHYRSAFSEVTQNGVAVCNRDVTSVRWLETKSVMMGQTCVCFVSVMKIDYFFSCLALQMKHRPITEHLPHLFSPRSKSSCLLLTSSWYLMTENLQRQGCHTLFIQHVLFLTRWSCFFLGFSHKFQIIFFFFFNLIYSINVSDAWWPQQHTWDTNVG